MSTATVYLKTTPDISDDNLHLQRFNDEWETKCFEEIFKRLNGNFHKIQTSEYSAHGLHPVVDQGQDTIVAFSDQTEKLFKCPAGGVIVFGDHTRIVKFVDMDFLIGADGTQLLAVQDGSDAKFFFYQLLTKDIPNTGYNRHFKFLKDFMYEVPPLLEQRAIAEVLSDVDGLLNALEALIAKKRAIKQATMQQLLTGKTRLPGFSGAWETKQIGNVVSLYSEKNNLGADIPVLTCSKHLGFVDSLSYFKNQVFSKDLSSYKIIRRGQIGYPINHVEEGSIGLQDLYDVALVSPIYVVCSPEKDINSFFLHRLLKLESYRQEFANATMSSINRRGSLRWPAFSKIHVTLPSIDEQVAIAAVLNDVETEIAALEKRRDKTRAIKQGMMQQLLTGRVRLVKSE